MPQILDIPPSRRERFLSNRLSANVGFLSPRSNISSVSRAPSDAHALVPRRGLEVSRWQADRKTDVLDAIQPVLERRNQTATQASRLQGSLRSQYTSNSGRETCDADTRRSCTHINRKNSTEKHLLEKGVAPVFDPKTSVALPAHENPILPDLSDLRMFINSPGPIYGGNIQCHIRRDEMANKLFPCYRLYLTEGDHFLLSARKRKRSKTCNYVISLDEKHISTKNGHYFGKLRSNFLGTEFRFYNNGECPSDEFKLGHPQVDTRIELAIVLYKKNMFGLRGPRNLTVIIPSIVKDDQAFLSQSRHATQQILSNYKRGVDLDQMIVMKNKMQQAMPKVAGYDLNFNGRVTKYSAKNFQLKLEDGDDYVTLRFGKAGHNFFIMDYRYPVSALQAFAICLSSLDKKLAVSTQIL